MQKRLLLVTMILLGSVACDQGTKRIAAATLEDIPTIHLLGDVIRLTYIENTGAFLGMGSTLPEWIKWILFVLFPLALVGVVVVAAFRGRFKQEVTLVWLGAMALVAGGGLGNVIDRVFRDGRVIDFMNLGIGRLRTGIFNVADLCVVFGVALLFWIGRKQSGEKAQEHPSG